MKLVFEVATIQDAISKAARIAPTRGSALESAAGILISVVEGVVSVRATNNLVFFHTVVDALEVEGDGEWRLGSVILGDFFSKLPIVSGVKVTIKDEGSGVRITSGTKRAMFRLIPPQYFPNWEVFNSDDLQSVDNMKEVIDAVKWAASKDNAAGVLCGLHFDGTHVYSTDRYRIAKFNCVIPNLVAPITVPTSIFDPISKTLGEVEVGVSPDGHFLLMPDESTQVKGVIYADEYPRIGAAVNSDQPNQIKINKTVLTSMIDMAMVFSGFNRTPLLNLIVGQEQIVVHMEEGENKFLDEFDIAGQAVHKRVYIDFTPRNLLDALNAAPNEVVLICYDWTEPGKPVRIEGGSSYEAWVMPRRKDAPTSEDGS